MLATVLTVGVLSACGNTATTEEPADDTTGETVTEEPTDEAATGEYPITPDELGSGEVKWTEETTADGWNLVTNDGGTSLGYSPDSGLALIQVDGYAFKDLNGNSLLDGYEDWRQEMEVRSADIASLLTIEDIAGLMLYSGHQSSVSKTLTEDQTTFLDQGLRAVLNAASASSTTDQAEWNNSMQAYAEGGSTLGIPVNMSTDPRTTGVSVWPGNLALTATFDTELALEASAQLSKEYRALGIGTYLGPQIDMTTDPRWSRTSGALGEDPALARDIASAIVSGFQSTWDESGSDLGWGSDSVNAMAKHWVAEGAGQAGREGHTFRGQFAVFPGGNFDAHLIPFVDGAFNLDSATGSATAIMSSYTIAYSEDKSLGEYVGSSFSEYKIGLLRDTYGFDGVVCTDWGVATKGGMIDTGHGVMELENPDRILLAIKAGVDQFGGNNDPAPVIEAYNLLVAEEGEEAALARFQDSGRRLLKNYFYVGLFDNPYVSVATANEVVGNAEAVAAGLAAQNQTITMLKNENNIIAQNTSEEKPTVYVPLKYTPSSKSFLSFGASYGSIASPVAIETLEQYFTVVTDTISETLTGPADADGNPTPSSADIVKASPADVAACDYALVFISSPNATWFTQGYNDEGEYYEPISLQYLPYTADSESVRTVSIVGPMVTEEISNGYVVEKVQKPTDINYFGKSVVTQNAYDLETVLYAAENNENVIVALNANYPSIVSEFESQVDSILVGYSCENAAFLEIVAGNVEPSALLPFQMPANMETVEAQFEDVPRDMEVHVDAAGNAYDFAYGLNWSGVINDERVTKYNVEPLTTPAN